MSAVVEAAKRYHVVNQGPGYGALVEGVPDPEHPDDPKKDRRDGAPVVVGETGVGGSLWRDILALDVVWTDRGFKRFWEYAPLRAARVRDLAL